MDEIDYNKFEFCDIRICRIISLFIYIEEEIHLTRRQVLGKIEGKQSGSDEYVQTSN